MKRFWCQLAQVVYGGNGVKRSTFGGKEVKVTDCDTQPKIGLRPGSRHRARSPSVE